MNSLQFLGIIWRTGNHWLRWAIIVVFLQPVAVALTSLIGWPALTAIVALSPLYSFIAFLLACNTVFASHPRGRYRYEGDVAGALTLIAFAQRGRTALKQLAGIAGLELAVGVFFAVLPVANDRGLVPLALLLLLAIAFLAIAGYRRLAALLGVVLAVVTLIFLMGGREEISRHIAEARATATAPTSGGWQTFVVGPRDEVRVALPPNSLAQFCTDKDLFVRPVDGGDYELRPPCKVFKIEHGEVVPAAVMGDVNGSGIFFFRAKMPGLAQLTLATARK